MGASVNHKYMTIAFSLNGKDHRLQLANGTDHLYLPFQSCTVVLTNGTPSEGKCNALHSGLQYYSRHEKYFGNRLCDLIGKSYYSTGSSLSTKANIDSERERNRTTSPHQGPCRAKRASLLSTPETKTSRNQTTELWTPSA